MRSSYPEGTMLVFTKQDLATFLVGLGAALAVTLGESLVLLETTPMEDIGLWARNLGVGFAAAAGRYLLTEMTQRGIRAEEPEPEVEEEYETESVVRRNLLTSVEPVESVSVIKP